MIAPLSDEDRGELYIAAVLCCGLFDRVEIVPEQVVSIIDERDRFLRLLDEATIIGERVGGPGGCSLNDERRLLAIRKEAGLE